jgi:hypothetical protein
MELHTIQQAIRPLMCTVDGGMEIIMKGKDLFGRLGRRPWTAFITMSAFGFFVSGTMAKKLCYLTREPQTENGKKKLEKLYWWFQTVPRGSSELELPPR